jgi:hypothetical protein
VVVHGRGVQASDAVLLRIQRHADHHMRAARPFHALDSAAGAPRLPASYSAMLLLSLVPPLWFALMNPRVHLLRVLADVCTAGASSATTEQGKAVQPLVRRG